MEVNEVERVNIIIEEADGITINPLATEPEIEITYAQEEPTIHCRVCGLSFASSDEFEDHNVRLHARTKIPCPICNTLFQRQDHMRRHIRTVHSQDTTCPVCKEDCKEENVLAKHLIQCSPDNKYYCRKCGYITDTLPLLQTHETCHVLSPRHECEECSATFKRRDHLIRHVKSRHLMEFVNCELCNQNFKRRDHMLRHVREKHNMVYKNGELVVNKFVRRPKPRQSN